MIIDAQVHLWTAESPSRQWPSDGQRRAHLKTPLSYGDMLSEMDRTGVDRAIIVPPSWEGDRNDYASLAAHRYPDRFAVMGRLCLEDPESRPLLKTLIMDPAILGVRVNFSDSKLRWLSDGTADWFWPAAEKADIPVMLHCPGQQQKIAEIAEHHSSLKIIIDHMNLSTRLPVDAIADSVRATANLGRFPNLSVKLSSIPVYSRDNFPYANFDHHLRHMIDSFSAERCHWGSDISHGKGEIPYENYVRHFTEGTFFRTETERSWIMGKSLQNILKWPIDHS